MENSRLVPDPFVGSAPTRTERVRSFSRTHGVVTLLFCSAVVVWIWQGLGEQGLDFHSFGAHPRSSIASICALVTLVGIIVWYMSSAEGTVRKGGAFSVFSTLSYLLLLTTLIKNLH